MVCRAVRCCLRCRIANSCPGHRAAVSIPICPIFISFERISLTSSIDPSPSWARFPFLLTLHPSSCLSFHPRSEDRNPTVQQECSRMGKTRHAVATANSRPSSAAREREPATICCPNSGQPHRQKRTWIHNGSVAYDFPLRRRRFVSSTSGISTHMVVSKVPKTQQRKKMMTPRLLLSSHASNFKTSSSEAALAGRILTALSGGVLAASAQMHNSLPSCPSIIPQIDSSSY